MPRLFICKGVSHALGGFQLLLWFSGSFAAMPSFMLSFNLFPKCFVPYAGRRSQFIFHCFDAVFEVAIFIEEKGRERSNCSAIY